jgi:hypothetical protein
MMVPEPAVALAERLGAVEKRLDRLAWLPPQPGLTDPDVPSGERWEWGQVWAHLAEFPLYWMEEVRRAVALPADEMPTFGRIKSDPVRVTAIDANRDLPVPELWSRVQVLIRELRALLQELTEADWERRISHPTLGAMDIGESVDRFLVAHLEEHAEQLEKLADEAV